MELAITRIMNGLLCLLAVALLLTVGLSVWNVVARYAFDAALLWADEIASFALIVMTWLGAIIVAWRGGDIAMSLFVEALPVPLKSAGALLQNAVVFGICGWAAWLSFRYVLGVYRFGMTSDAARIVIWPVHGAMTVGLVCISAIALSRLFKSARLQKGE